jgi:hypothetical protein
MMTDKADEQSIPMTHDVLAQVVGGRHAVTGRLERAPCQGRGCAPARQGRNPDRSVLIAQACECYRST